MKTEELNGILQLELEYAETFVALLKREQGALINGDIEVLTLLSIKKISIVNQLMQLHEERSQLLTASNSQIETAEFNVLLPPTTNIAQQCQALLQSAKQLNQTNETILAHWLRQTRQSLQALRGAAGQAELYNPKGLTV
ncbi:flagella synthesis protein FlgN [Nitrosomonas mobilis]|uniref:Flagella synthesis protein FlgN n=1 Tax=Nitrosomonas mobilis TaxID=51642 RepID=A0A1G5SGJ3_9PROT|nr:flagellar protein FlgN [Nitrosomonas mobilis]SCZ86232.1 conserved hypothetical protein [Nitrosomonas mobilis]HNO74232.1 flagellar protein FlgN [Nitrosomonas mobilis]